MNNEIFFLLSHKLSIDVVKIINNFIYSKNLNKIIKKYKNFILYKYHIIDSIYELPVHNRMFPSINEDPDSYDFNPLFIVVVPESLYYFNKLSKLINGNELYIDEIEQLFSVLADSIDDYEWVWYSNNINYIKLKKICENAKEKFNFSYLI